MARKPKQMEIEGTEQKKIAAIEHAADALDDVRTRRVELNAEEESLQEKLAKLMEKHELPVYSRPGYGTVVVEEVKTKRKVKVKREDPEHESPAEE